MRRSRGRGDRCNVVSTGGEYHFPWLNERYLFASNAGSGGIAAGITKFTSSHGTEYFHHRGTRQFGKIFNLFDE